MMGPQRIQRKRTKGWRMPEGAVYVGRPTRWGNPFRAGGSAMWRSMGVWHWTLVNDDAMAVALYREWLAGTGRPFDIRDCRMTNPRHVVSLLRGADLACWCPLDQPCHADVLLEIANGKVAA